MMRKKINRMAKGYYKRGYSQWDRKPRSTPLQLLVQEMRALLRSWGL